MRRMDLLVTALCASVLLSIPQSNGQVNEPRAIITINKHVFSSVGSAYQLRVFANGQADFIGFDAKVKEPRTIRVSDAQIKKALRVFNEVGFERLESSELSYSGAHATIILERDGVPRSVSFPTSGGSLREYAILIRSM